MFTSHQDHAAALALIAGLIGRLGRDLESGHGAYPESWDQLHGLAELLEDLAGNLAKSLGAAL